MTQTLVWRLIAKDWYLSRVPLATIAAAGTISIALLFVRGETAGFIGLTCAFVAMVCLAILLPIQTIVNERKKQNLPFVMSLPISPAEYTTAKIVGNLAAFVAIWLAITVAGLVTIMASGPYGGVIPIVIVSALTPFVAFSLLLGVAIVLESETWTITVMGACNIAYTFAWFFLMRVPGIHDQMKGSIAVWSQPLLTILGGEIAVIVLAIALTFYFQSKKTDFI